MAVAALLLAGCPRPCCLPTGLCVPLVPGSNAAPIPAEKWHLGGGGDGGFLLLTAPRGAPCPSPSPALAQSAGIGARQGPQSLPVSISDGAEEVPEPKNSSFSSPERSFPAETWFLKGGITKSHLKRREGGCAAQQCHEAWAGRGSFRIFAPGEDESQTGFSWW